MVGQALSGLSHGHGQVTHLTLNNEWRPFWAPGRQRNHELAQFQSLSPGETQNQQLGIKFTNYFSGVDGAWNPLFC